MSIRFSRLAMGVLVVAAVVLMAGQCWAVYHGLGPSKDEWGLKYDVAVNDADGDKVNVVFTLADEGRLTPFYSIELIVLSKQLDSQGGHTYDVKAPIELKAVADGKREGQLQMRKEFGDRAKIRILTLTVNGKRNKSASYFDIPLRKYMSKDSANASTATSAPAAKATK